MKDLNRIKLKNTKVYMPVFMHTALKKALSYLLIVSMILSLMVVEGPTTMIAAAGTAYYVKASAGTNGSGASWDDPLNADGFALKLHTASGGEKFYLAEGTYTPKYNQSTASSASDASFYISASVEIYGGYNRSSVGTDLSGRSERLYETILSGRISETVNSGRVVNIQANNVLLDGLTVRDGVGNLLGYMGGGISIGGGSATVNNCIITNNTALVGGGIYSSGSYLTISNCTVSNNYSISDGGGLYLGSSANIINTTIADNGSTTGGNGGGGITIFAYGAINITNCTIYNNNATRYNSSYGGGITARNCTLNLTNNTVAGNKFSPDNSSTYDGAGGLYAESCIVNMKGNIIGGNSGGTADISMGENPGNGTINDLGYNITTGVQGYTPNPDTDSTKPSFQLAEAYLQTLLEYSGTTYQLKDNGGLTKTIRVTGASRTIGSGKTINCMPAALRPSTDQTGVLRRSNNNSTIGAYETPTYTITFDANGGNGNRASYGAYEGEVLTMDAAEFSRTGYTFAGWAESVNADAPVVCSTSKSYTMPAKNVTFYAKWTPNDITITYRPGTGAAGTPVTQTAKADAPITFNPYPSAFTKPGYTQDGWSRTDGGDANYVAGQYATMFTADTVLYAHWKPNQNSLVFSANGGTGTMQNQFINTNASANLYQCVFTRAGYTFAGWNTKADGTGTPYADQAGYVMGTNASATLYARWTANLNTLQFEPNGAAGTMPGQKIATDVKTPLNANQYIRTGYSFTGWNTKADGTGTPYANQADYTMGPNGNYVLYAQWTPKTYNITYNKNNPDAAGTMNPQPVIYNAGASLNPNGFTYPGYTFTGWASAPAGDAAYPDGADFLMDCEGITLYAVWKANTNTVEFRPNGGTGNVSVQEINTDAIKPLSPNTFTRPGYTFTGWNERADGTGTNYADRASYTMGPAGIVLYAVWEANLNTITFHPGSAAGGTYTQQIRTDETADLFPSGFSRYGYTQTGWQSGGAGSSIPLDQPYKMGPDADYNFYAVWQENEYDLTFDPNGTGITGSMPPVSMLFDSVITLPECGYGKPGYTFTGYGEYPDGEAVYRPGDVYFMTSENAVLFTVWQADSNTIIFHSNDGNDNEMRQALKTDEAGTLNANEFMRYGYTFLGWAVSENGEVVFRDSEDYIMGTQSEYDLYAVWEANEYNVIFDGNGAASGMMPPQVIAFDDTAVLDGNAYAREGYVFTGWSDEAGTEYADRSAYPMQTEGVTLYAIWSANDNIITFDAQGGEGYMPPQTIKTHTAAPLMKNELIKKGHTFEGWSNGSSATGSLEPAKAADYLDEDTYEMGTGPVTLYAVWSANPYKVTFEGNGSGSAYSQTLIYDSPAALMQNQFQKDGYTFAGWSQTPQTDFREPDPPFDLTDGSTYTINDGDIILYAVWKPVIYTVTFKAGTNGRINGGTTDVRYEFLYGDDLVIPGVMPEDLYYFAGWDGALELKVKKDAAYTALWTDCPTYRVHFDDHNGTGTMPPQTIQQTDTKPLYANTFTKPGHTFAGWSLTPHPDTIDESEGISVIIDYKDGADLTMSGADVTLYAVWKINYYNVTFLDHDGSTLKAVQSVKYDTGALPPAGPVRAGYTFTGWDSSYSHIDKDCTVTAVYTADQNTITYKNGGGTGADYTQKIHTDATARLLQNNFTRTGYEFAGFSQMGLLPQDHGTKVYAANSLYTMGTSDVTLTAVWRALRYDIRFNGGGGGGSTPAVPCYYDGTVPLPECGFTRTGYTFKGWSDGSKTYSAGSEYTLRTTGITLTAVWGADEYTITFHADGGAGGTTNGSAGEKEAQAVLTMKALTGQKVTLPDGTFMRPGYTFAGWAKTPAGIILNSYIMPAGDTALYAIWTANTNTITLHHDGKTHTISAKTDETVRLSDGTFMRPGYTLLGYSAQSGQAGIDYDYALNETIKMPGGDITLYAVWTAKTNSLVFRSNNGRGETVTQKGKTDETVELPENTFEKRGYTFSHWSDRINDGNSYKPGTSYTVTADALTNFYAVYTPDTYIVTFDAGGGEGGMAVHKAVFDSEVTLPENTYTRTGYDFKCWNTDEDGEGTAFTDTQSFNYTYGDITLYAIWEARENQILFEPNGGKGEPYVQLIKQDDTKQLLKCSFMREGYTFAGWSVYTDGAPEYANQEKFEMTEPAVTLYAVWTPNMNTITYKGNGATDGEMPVQKIATDAAGYLLCNQYYRENYTFTGWSLEPDGEAEYENETQYTMGIKNVTLYAVWKADAGQIIFDANAPHEGSTPIQSHDLNERFTLNRNEFVCRGYDFAGWSESPDGQVQYPDGAEIILTKKSLILYAVWSPGINFVIFDACGGEGEDFQLEVGTGETKPLLTNTFTKAGYHFAGWSTQPGQPDYAGGESVPKNEDDRQIDYPDEAPYTSHVGDTRLYAVWEADTNRLVFNSGSGEMAVNSLSDYSQSIQSDESTTLAPCAFTRPGYTFLGWSTVENEEVEYEDGASYMMGVEDTTLYAVWEANEYSVIFDANAPGCEGYMEPQIFKYGVPGVLAPCEYERDGYTFTGWRTEPCPSGQNSGLMEFLLPDGSDFMPEAKDQILFAQWKADTVEIKLYANIDDDVESDPVIIQYGPVDSITRLNPNTFDNPGYIFDGWSNDPVKYKPEDIEESGGDDTDDDAVSGQEINEVVFEDDPDPDDTETDEEELDFLNPDKEVRFNNRDEIIVPAADVVLYAKWRVDEDYVKSILSASEPDGDSAEDICIDEKAEDADSPDIEENEVETPPSGNAENNVAAATAPAAVTPAKNAPIPNVKVTYYFNGAQIGDAVTKPQGTQFKSFTKPSLKISGFVWCRKISETGKATVYRKLDTTAKIESSMKVYPCYAVKFYNKGVLKGTVYVPYGTKFKNVAERPKLKISGYDWSLKGKREVKSTVNKKTVTKKYTSYSVIKDNTTILSNVALYATYKVQFKGRPLNYKDSNAKNKSKATVLIDTIHVPCGETPAFSPKHKTYEGYNFVSYRSAVKDPKTKKQKRVTKTVNGKKVTSRVWKRFSTKKKVTGSRTYYTNYERKKVKITFNYRYSGKKKTVSYNYGYLFNKNSVKTPVRNYYDFAGWKDKNGRVISSFEVKSKQTIYAYWLGKTYTITLGTYTLPDGTTAPGRSTNKIYIQYPNKFVPGNYKLGNIVDRYYFDGWSSKTNGSSALKAFTVKSNRTIYPVFKPVTYTVTFVGNYSDGTKYTMNKDGKTVTAEQSVKVQKYLYGDKKPLNKNSFTKEGYIFIGWQAAFPGTLRMGDPFYNHRTGKWPGADFKNMEEVRLSQGTDVFLYAVYQQNKVTITYKSRKEIKDAYYGEPQLANSEKGTYDTQYVKADSKFKPVGNDRINFVSWNTQMCMKNTFKSMKNIPEELWEPFGLSLEESYLPGKEYAAPVKSLVLYEQTFEDVCIFLDGMDSFNATRPFIRLDVRPPLFRLLNGEAVEITAENKYCAETKNYYYNYIVPIIRDASFGPVNITDSSYKFWTVANYGMSKAEKKDATFKTWFSTSLSGVGLGVTIVAGGPLSAIVIGSTFFGGNVALSINDTYYIWTGNNMLRKLIGNDNIYELLRFTWSMSQTIYYLRASIKGYTKDIDSVTDYLPVGKDALRNGVNDVWFQSWSDIKYTPVNPGPLSNEVASTFNGASYTRKVLAEDTIFYRVHGGTANKVGSYMSRTKQNGGLQSQMDLALDPKWGNTATSVTKVTVPKGTVVYEGTAAPQGNLLGGGNQVFIPREVLNSSWFGN